LLFIKQNDTTSLNWNISIPFLPQPSQFILTWDRHQISWLAYPVAWLKLSLLKHNRKQQIIFTKYMAEISTIRQHTRAHKQIFKISTQKVQSKNTNLKVVKM